MNGVVISLSDRCGSIDEAIVKIWSLNKNKPLAILNENKLLAIAIAHTLVKQSMIVENIFAVGDWERYLAQTIG